MEEIWRNIRERIVEARPTEEKKGKTEKRGASWWDEECWERRRAVRKLLRVFRGEKDHDIRAKTRVEYCKQKQEMRRLFKQKKEEDKERWVLKMKEVATEVEFWKEINRMGGSKRKDVPTEIKMEEWERHFKQLLGEVYGSWEKTKESKKWVDYGSIISQDEVYTAVKKLRYGKAAGSDGLENEVWKRGTMGVVNELTRLINEVWKTNEMPEEWRMAIIWPIFKGGERKRYKIIKEFHCLIRHTKFLQWC